MCCKVSGFSFPLFCEEDVERLEKTVRENAIIRRQYVTYLQLVKPYHLSVDDVFSSLFTDIAMYNYWMPGLYDESIVRNKKNIAEYIIFISCMLDAWRSHGLTQVRLINHLQTIVAQLSKRRQISSLNRRKRSEQIQLMLMNERKKNYVIFINKTILQKWEISTIDTLNDRTDCVTNIDSDSDDEEDFPQYKVQTGITFPIKSREMVERLEKAVRSDPTVREQYVNLLRKQRQQTEKPSFAFLKLFADKALHDYNYSGRCNFAGSKKIAMKDYWIFAQCVSDAWGDTESADDIRQHICSAITLVNNRKRGARFRSKRKQ
ncbi:uncharacterized protein LOC128745675 [Sabethes cyaneus]|uniref:uncharacterized protein LOC128745675 n=1 Tax=Sabethes cyaneus TaxID=53552 RepID=UPI00237EAA9A|nr:uncharacterized protein LOC128745675 [Sabethes cyaneus]